MMAEFIHVRKLKAEKFSLITTEDCFSQETKKLFKII